LWQWAVLTADENKHATHLQLEEGKMRKYPDVMPVKNG
jgi:hypothetical protein